jgi:hypothetical protein
LSELCGERAKDLQDRLGSEAAHLYGEPWLRVAQRALEPRNQKVKPKTATRESDHGSSVA